MLSEMRDWLRRIERRVILTVGRGRVTASNDSGSVQLLQVRLGDNEVRDNTYRLSEFGFASLPPLQSDVIVLFAAGDRSNGVIIATGNQQYRLTGLQGGEVALYDQVGKHVYLKADGIEVEAKGQPVTVNNAESVTVNGPTTINGDVTINGKITATGLATFSNSVDVTGTVKASGEGTFNNVDVSGHKHPFEAQAGSTPLITDGPQG